MPRVPWQVESTSQSCLGMPKRSWSRPSCHAEGRDWKLEVETRLAWVSEGHVLLLLTTQGRGCCEKLVERSHVSRAWSY